MLQIGHKVAIKLMEFELFKVFNQKSRELNNSINYPFSLVRFENILEQHLSHFML